MSTKGTLIATLAAGFLASSAPLAIAHADDADTIQTAGKDKDKCKSKDGCKGKDGCPGKGGEKPKS